MDDQLSDASSDVAKAKQRSHEDVAMDLLGNLDPSFSPISPEEEQTVLADFLGPTMTHAVAQHVQTCAQVLYKAMLECVANTTYDAPPYDALPPMRSSLSIFHGRTQTKRFLRRITRDNVARIVADVHMKAQEPVTVAGLTVMFVLPFMRHHSSNAALDLRESDFVLNFPQDPKAPDSKVRFVDKNNVTGVHRYALGNGVGVNVRALADDEIVQKGEVQLQVVALGGLASQVSSLKGACQFINTVKANGLSLAKARLKADTTNPPQLMSPFEFVRNEGSVHHPDTHRNPDKEPEHKDASQGLSCEAEFMRVTVKLSSACGDDDDDEDCDVAGKDYSKNLRYALDEMRPQYDERTTKLAHQEHEKQLDALGQDLRSDDVMKRGIIPGLLAVMFPHDSRSSPVSLADLKELDPLEVNRWVREHFVPGRFEINIAGHLNHDNLLNQVNTVFGSLPIANFSRHVQEDNVTAGLLHRVGLDPYDPEDKPSFLNHNWGADKQHKLRSACVLRSPTPDHGHVILRVPASDYQASATRPMVRRMADRALSRMLFLRMRRDNGFCYHIGTVARHSVLFPGYGHYEMEWVAGRYSVHQGSPEFRKDLNVIGSKTVASDVFREEVSEAVYAEVVNTEIQRINASYSDADYWLHIMQGVSIHPPTTWPQTTVHGDLPGLFSVDSVDEIQGLAALSRDEVNDFLKRYSWDPQDYLWGIVTTRSYSYVAKDESQNDVECPMPDHII
jgi:hypothetical protein